MWRGRREEGERGKDRFFWCGFEGSKSLQSDPSPPLCFDIRSMDSDLWISRLAAAKRQYSRHHHQNSQSGLQISSFFFDYTFRFGPLMWFLFMFRKKISFFIGAFVLNNVDRFVLDDFEMEEEVRPDFPCPYCYEDHDITSLCAHLEDEHLFESKIAVSIQFLLLCHQNSILFHNF